MSEFRYGYQPECTTNDLPNCPINESGESNKTAYTRTEGEYESLERQLEEAREDVKTYKYDLDTLVSIIHDCLYNMSQEECYDTFKQVDDHYKKLKEKGGE